jgi:hypothetical protein
MEPVLAIRERIIDEIFFALGMQRQGSMRRVLGRLFYAPANHLARIAAILEDEAPRSGLSGASQRALPELSVTPSICGKARVPREGPLLVVSNHPGTYDPVVVTASIPRRDLKLVASDVGFTHALVNCSRDFIFVSTDPSERMAALRACIRYLSSGGAVLIFPSGEVEPDPALLPEEAAETFQNWSASIEIMLRKVPDAWLQLVMISGMLLPAFMRSPLTRIRRRPYHRQKMAELLQIIQQMIFPKSIAYSPLVTFAQPICARQLPEREIMPEVVQRARNLLFEHVAQIEPVSSSQKVQK